jgi:hypothetical protein
VWVYALVLARHYGLIGDPEKTAARSWKIRHWGADGFRPSMDSWLESN